MENKFYTIDQIAEIMGLHHKTIRKFISEGKLGATKAGRGWRISKKDLDVFMKNGNHQAEDSSQEELMVEYAPQLKDIKDTSSRIHVSTVVDISKSTKEDYMRISNTLIAVGNCKDASMEQSSIQVKYDEKDERIRVILWGSLSFMEEMLSTIEMLATT
jgi:excisionase family DNA binding protein